MRGTAVLAGMLALAGCGSKTDSDAPLAFVPADTPYVIANTEPMPDATVAHFAQQMKVVWPIMFDSIDHGLIEIDKALDEGKKSDADSTGAKVMHALLDEFRERDTPEKWQQIGMGPKVRSAIYGIGLLPVVRFELADADAFRAMIARIEQKIGAKLPIAKIGTQDVWTFGNDAVLGLMAIEGRHLVITALPAAADEALKRRVLGLDRPAKSLADSGALAELDKARGYLPYGSGWIDTHRVLALLLDDPSLAALAHGLGAQPPAFEPACRVDFERIATNVPRLSFGYTALDADRMEFKGRLELAPLIAQALARIAGAPPGPPAGKDSLADFGITMPVLKARDFWVEQADAVAKAPFRCAALAPLNETFADAKEKLGEMIPPPLSDFTGLRVTISHFAWADGAAKPDVSGIVLLGSSNPSFLTSLAQTTVPALAGLKLAADGKPVALPAGVLPAEVAGDLDLHVAMSANLLGVAVGKDESARLGAAIATPAAPAGTLLDSSYSGEIYTVFDQMIGRFGSAMPAEQRQQFESQRKLYAFYAKWFKRFEARVTAGSEGVDFSESVEFAKP
jgi:hypothetical protein